MLGSKLQQIIQKLSAQERRDAHKFLRSPYFNTRSDVPLLFEACLRNPLANKEALWSEISADTPYQDQAMRLLMSYLVRLLEQFLATQAALADVPAQQLYLAEWYQKQGMNAAFDKTRLRTEQLLEEQPLRDADYYQTLHQLAWQEYNVRTVTDPTYTHAIERLAETADIAYLAKRLRLICVAAAQKGVYQSDAALPDEQWILALAESPAKRQYPIVDTYLHCYRMLRRPDEEAHFQALKSRLLALPLQFKPEETRGLHLMAINFCVKKINSGQKPYYREVLDLYRAGLDSGYLFENGILSRFTYHNMVAAALQVGDLNWAEYVIHQFKNALERRYRESSFSFNLARLEYARKRYDAVLTLLQNANYRDPLLNLAAKTLLLKTWYDLGEYDLLHSHLDAMRNYIRRKRVIGYHKSNYLNILHLVGKLLKSHQMNAKALEKFKQEIRATDILTEREWLLQCLG